MYYNQIMLKFFSSILISFFLILLVSRFSPISAATNYDATLDITYQTIGNLDLKLNICSPKNLISNTPTLIFFHGGGLVGGSRSDGFNLLCNIVAPHGYNVISVDYRLAPEYVYPAQIDDAQYVIRWARHHAAEYHIDSNRLIAAGSSAGASLAATVATLDTTRYPNYGLPVFSSRVQGAIMLAGVYDFTHPFLLGNWDPTINVFRNNPIFIREFSAVTHITSDDGPFLLLHGDDDETNLPIQSTRMRNTLHSHEVAVHLLSFPGTHSVSNFAKPVVKEAIINFLDQYFPLNQPTPSSSPSTQSGDLNQDGVINLLDYNLLKAGFGTTYNLLDYNLLRANFGT